MNQLDEHIQQIVAAALDQHNQQVQTLQQQVQGLQQRIEGLEQTNQDLVDQAESDHNTIGMLQNQVADLEIVSVGRLEQIRLLQEQIALLNIDRELQNKIDEWN